MKTTEMELLESFERTARKYLSGTPALTGLWRLERAGRQSKLHIPSSSPDGFDVGATCETYGLYPWAGAWRGAPWEPVVGGVDQLCEEYFGFVRALISPDGRLRLLYRRDRLQMAVVEMRRPDGWKEFEKMRELILPLGKKHEVYRQNQHLPSRYPFAGLKLTEWGIYPWRDGA